MYKNKDIVHFKNPGSMITTGVIEGDAVTDIDGTHYYILDLGSNKHFKKESEIIKCVGSVYTNANRKKAEEWQKDKTKGVEYENAKNWKNVKAELGKL